VHIANIMFSAIAGGIEQAFVDYCEALHIRGHRVTAITHPKAAINPQLKALGIEPISLHNIGEWDIFAMRKLRRILHKLAPDVAVTHTHRSFALTRRANNGICPLVGITHNYHERAKRMLTADAVFTTTHDLIRFMMENGVAEDHIFHIPNMVRCHALPSRGPRHEPLVIGAMGRFVKKKGFEVFIDALALLRQRGYMFKAILGGTGAEEKHLKHHAHKSGMDEVLSFPGWIEDKKTFYSSLDIFCLPSLHEPFGIVLLEAFVYGTPVVATNSEGPRDIITPNFDALIVPMGNATELAAAIAKLLDNPQLAADLAANAFAKAKMNYSMESVAAQIEKALQTVVERWKK